MVSRADASSSASDVIDKTELPPLVDRRSGRGPHPPCDPQRIPVRTAPQSGSFPGGQLARSTFEHDALRGNRKKSSSALPRPLRTHSTTLRGVRTSHSRAPHRTALPLFTGVPAQGRKFRLSYPLVHGFTFFPGPSHTIYVIIYTYILQLRTIRVRTHGKQVADEKACSGQRMSCCRTGGTQVGTPWLRKTAISGKHLVTYLVHGCHNSNDRAEGKRRFVLTIAQCSTGMPRRVFLMAIPYLAAACLCRRDLIAVRTCDQLPAFCCLRREHIDLVRRYFSTDYDDVALYIDTHNDVLDHQLPSEYDKVKRIFEVQAGLRFIDDDDAPNAYAMPKSTDQHINDERDGTVLLGRTLLSKELQIRGGSTVSGIMAHEFGHIRQYVNQKRLYTDLTTNQPTQKLAELHADYMAGYYLRYKHETSNNSMDIAAFKNFIYEMGDYAFNDHTHHGTPSDRERAVDGGWACGRYGRLNIDEVAEQGAKFVRTMVL